MKSAAHSILAERTKAAHEKLHVHPRISRLFAPDFSEAEYRQLIFAYYRFYHAVEHSRRDIGCWHALSLQQSLNEFEADLSELNISIDCVDFPQTFIQGSTSCLAALYVLHGAKAGASVISKRLQKCHPKLSRRFFSTPRCEQTWRLLLNEINAIDTNDSKFQILCAKANETFTAFGVWVSENTDSVFADADKEAGLVAHPA